MPIAQSPRPVRGIAVCRTAAHKTFLMDQLKLFVKEYRLANLAGAPPKPSELLKWEAAHRSLALSSTPKSVASGVLGIAKAVISVPKTFGGGGGGVGMPGLSLPAGKAPSMGMVGAGLGSSGGTAGSTGGAAVAKAPPSTASVDKGVIAAFGSSIL